MNTLILLSGGWRSLNLLIRWLRTHSEKVAVLHCQLGDGFDNDRDRGYVAAMSHIAQTFPDRVQWYDSTFAHIYPTKTDPREILRFHVEQFRKLSGVEVRKILVPVACGLGKAETVIDQVVMDALVEIPVPVFGRLMTCSKAILPCGKCPACVEIETARNQRG